MVDIHRYKLSHNTHTIISTGHSETLILHMESNGNPWSTLNNNGNHQPTIIIHMPLYTIIYHHENCLNIYHNIPKLLVPLYHGLLGGSAHLVSGL